jgi:IclR family transcriptional regulator, pca regulon regulatory protein
MVPATQINVRIASKQETPVPPADRSTVQSIAKAFAVLHAFDPARPEMTITDVANRTGLDRGTAFRMIHTLAALGFLAAVPDSRRFRLTLKCLELGYAAMASGGLKEQSAPLLRDMVPEIADAASLGVLEGADVVYVERAQVDMGRQTLDRRIGSRTGAYATALGHAILAFREPAEARAVLASAERVRMSDRMLVDLDALCDRLAAVRARGYAVSDGENAYGLRTVAAPVFGRDGLPLAGVSLTVRSERMALDAFTGEAVPRLLQTARALSDAVRMTQAAA